MNKRFEKLSKQEIIGTLLLNKCNNEIFNYDYLIVLLKEIYIINKFELISQVEKSSQRRIRLLSPYREYLSQSFASVYSRVALIEDLNPLTDEYYNEKDIIDPT